MAAPSGFFAPQQRDPHLWVEQRAALTAVSPPLEFDELIQVWRDDPPVNRLGSKVARVSSDSETATDSPQGWIYAQGTGRELNTSRRAKNY
jgi:hypothetical protein